jgi:hypothetical protein
MARKAGQLSHADRKLGLFAYTLDVRRGSTYLQAIHVATIRREMKISRSRFLCWMKFL